MQLSEGSQLDLVSFGVQLIKDNNIMIFGGLKIGSTSFHNEVHNLDLDFKEEQKFKEKVSITENED